MRKLGSEGQAGSRSRLWRLAVGEGVLSDRRRVHEENFKKQH